MYFRPEGVSFEANSLRVDVSKAVSNKYATESMLYLTAGLWDLYANTNIDTETAILKVIQFACKLKIEKVKIIVIVLLGIFTKCIAVNGNGIVQFC